MQALLIKMEFLEQFCLAFKKKKILLDLSAKQITHMAKIMNDVYFFKKFILRSQKIMVIMVNIHLHAGMSVPGTNKGGNFIYPMMHRFKLYYQASERT